MATLLLKLPKQIDSKCRENQRSQKFEHLMCPHRCSVEEKGVNCGNGYIRSRKERQTNPERPITNIISDCIHIYNKSKLNTPEAEYLLRNRNNGKTRKSSEILVPGTGRRNTSHEDRAQRAANERKKRQRETMHEKPRKRKK